jgi:hypothetical protein
MERGWIERGSAAGRHVSSKQQTYTHTRQAGINRAQGPPPLRHTLLEKDKNVQRPPHMLAPAPTCSIHRL